MEKDGQVFHLLGSNHVASMKDALPAPLQKKVLQADVLINESFSDDYHRDLLSVFSAYGDEHNANDKFDKQFADHSHEAKTIISLLKPWLGHDAQQELNRHPLWMTYALLDLAQGGDKENSRTFGCFKISGEY